MAWIVRILTGIVFLLVVATLGLWLAVERGWLNSFIERQASDAIGYDVTLAEAPSLGWENGALRLEIGPLSLKNIEGEKLADLRQARFALALGPLLEGSLVLPLVAVDGLDVSVERDAAGVINWQERADDEAQEEPAEPALPSLPELRRIRLSDTEVSYRQAADDTRLTLSLDELNGSWGKETALSLEGSGRLNDLEMTLEAGGPSIAALEAGGAEMADATAALSFAQTDIEARATPDFATVTVDLDLRRDVIGLLAQQELVASTMPPLDASIRFVPDQDGPGATIDASIEIARTTASFDGRLERLALDSDLVGTFSAEGPNPGRLLDQLDWPSIETPPFSIDARIERAGTMISLSEIAGRFGDSDVSGELSADLAGSPVPVTADLYSRLLDFDDLFPLVGLPPKAGPEETAAPRQAEAWQEIDERSRILPQATIDPADWRGFDVDIEYQADEIRSDFLPIDRIDVHLVARNGWLTLDPVHTGLADGDLLLFGSFDTTQRPPVGRVDARLEAFELEEVMAKLGIEFAARGEVTGRVRLEGRGRSLAALFADAQGRAGLVVSDGQVDALLLEAAGLDLFEGLIVLIADDGDDVTAPIRCAVANLDVEGGVATSRPFVLDTRDSKITATGTVDLADETLDLLVEVHPKDPSLLSGNQPVQIEGDWRSPTVAPAPGGIEDNQLAWLLAPLAALFPFIDLGLAEDAPCGELIAEARDAAAQPPGGE